MEISALLGKHVESNEPDECSDVYMNNQHNKQVK